MMDIVDIVIGVMFALNALIIAVLKRKLERHERRIILLEVQLGKWGKEAQAMTEEFLTKTKPN